ncbi:DMT family transporter [Streptomyces sp. cmx-4-9]|uniref:DMT family transporter n=1 Tax=Streptomyces sp. cmx-4-9 TaxID=2790941 RepID=UPI0039810D29
MMNGQRGSLLRMVALALLWGSAFLWIKVALGSGLTPFQIAFVRSALGAAVLLALARAARQRLPRDPSTWGHLAVAAFFCNALPFLLFGIGERTVDSGPAGALHATTPLWAVVIGAAIGTERRIGPVRIGGLLLGFGGVLVMSAPWQDASLPVGGALTLLAAAASYAVGFAYMARRLTGRGIEPLALAAAQLLAATVLAVPGLWAEGAGLTLPGDLGPGAVLAVLVLGVFSTGFTFYLNYRLIADEGATSAATVGYLLPVVSVALGALVLDEAVGPRVLAGAAVVLLGVAATRRRTAAAAPDPEPVRRAPAPHRSTKRTPAATPRTPPAGRAYQPQRIGPVSRRYVTPPRTGEPLARMHCSAASNQVDNGPA